MIKFNVSNGRQLEADAKAAKDFALNKAKSIIEEIGADFTSTDEGDNNLRMLVFAQLAGVLMNVSVLAAHTNPTGDATSIVDQLLYTEATSNRSTEMGAKFPRKKGVE